MAKLKLPKQKGLVSNGEFIIYLAMAFLLSNTQGMVNTYRQAYLVDVLLLPSESVSAINLVTELVPLFLGFFITMFIDRAPKLGKPKFKPLVTMAAVPAGVFAVLLFFTPSALSQLSVMMMIVYQCVITIIYKVADSFAGTANYLQTVISPDHKERDKVISFRSISSAIGNSAPLVVVLVIGLIVKHDTLSGKAMMYLVSSVICGAASSLVLMFGARVVKERVTYSPVRVNPLLGYRDVLKNKWALLLLLSEAIKSFRGIASYMGVFLAAALLGDASKFILFGLPTGIGTMVGMLVVSALLKKLNSKQIYILSGVYSIVANAGAFLTGWLSFRHEGEMIYQVIFFVFLFLIGLQYGASNLLPDMFKSDVLEDIEAKTHKRLEASLSFIVDLGKNVSGAIAKAIAPLILYGATAFNFIHYVQQTEGVYLPQSDDTKVRLLLVYTMVQGLFMLLGSLPFFFYKLTGERKETIHAEVMAYRATLEQEVIEQDDPA